MFTIDSPVKAVIEKQNFIRSRMNGNRSNFMYQTQNSFDFRDSKDFMMQANTTQVSPKMGSTALLKDNPSSSHIKEINKYIKNLDSRLSIPKFENTSSSTKMKILKSGVGSEPMSPKRMSRADLKQYVLDKASKLRLSVESNEMMSQNERANVQSQRYRAQILKKVNAEDKDALFGSIKKDKGRNQYGGTYGENNGLKYTSPQEKSTAGSSGFGAAV